MSDTPPVEVTIREITELVRQFDNSGWGSLELDIHGMHLVLGKDGAPGTSATVTPAPPAESSSASAAAPAASAASVLAAPAAPAAPAPAAAVETAPAAPAAPAASESPVTSGAELVDVLSPVVGAFWTAPSPGEPPFVAVGDTVAAGQQVAIVEVMKLMSNVAAPVAGRIVEICANNSEMVEYEQVLFRIDPGQADA